MTDGRVGWVQVARGQLSVNDIELGEGDGLAISDAGKLNFAKGENAEFILFELG